MSTIVYRDAVVLVSGIEIQTALNELAVTYGAEMLDETTFGDDTRINRGGLFTGTVSGSGFFDNAVGVETILFAKTGTDDVVFAVFPDGITEGSTTTGRGYAMKGVLADFTVGEAVGALLGISFSAESRGIEA